MSDDLTIEKIESLEARLRRDLAEIAETVPEPDELPEPGRPSPLLLVAAAAVVLIVGAVAVFAMISGDEDGSPVITDAPTTTTPPDLTGPQLGTLRIAAEIDLAPARPSSAGVEHAGAIWIPVDHGSGEEAAIVRVDSRTFDRREVPLGSSGWISQLLPSPHFLWAILRSEQSSTLLRIDPDDGSTTTPLDMEPRHAIVADGGLWVSRLTDVARIDLDTSAIETYPYVNAPVWANLRWVGETDGSIWLADDYVGRLVEIDLQTREVAYYENLQFGAEANTVLADDSIWLFIYGPDRAVRFDLSTREAALVIGRRWQSPVFARGGIWMAGETAVTRFESSSGMITDEVPVRSIFGPIADPDRGLWVVDGSASLVRIDLDSRQVSHSLDLGLSTDPLRLLANEDHIWVVETDGTLRIVSTP